MSKHRLSPAPLPPLKKLHLSSESTSYLRPSLESALSDELILSIFSYLSWIDLCRAQATSGNWSRLATDNELWKNLYLKTFGHRLRGARGFFILGRKDGREIKSLPARAGQVPEVKDWKFMFRISSNWRNGRCATETLRQGSGSLGKTHMLLAGSLTITATSQSSLCPVISLYVAGSQHTLACPVAHNAHITALALDQSAPSTGHIRIAVFLSSGEFRIFAVNHNHPSSSCTELSYSPARRTSAYPVVQAAYHHPLLITLSLFETFTLSIYDLSSGNATATQTLTSFTSYPPTSLVLSTNSSNTYKLVIAYAIPVYPAHWTVGATELIIARPPSNSQLARSSSFLVPGSTPMTILSTRTIRAMDVPPGLVDQKKIAAMSEQWSRKVYSVADNQTDGKWVVLAPDDPGPRSSVVPSSSSTTRAFSMYSPTSLQLYRLSLPFPSSVSSPTPKLTFIRTLHGQLGPIAALSLSDGRCVSLGVNGSIWVWDLETATGAEVAGPLPGSELNDTLASVDAKRAVIFDERKILTAVNEHVVERRFDI